MGEWQREHWAPNTDGATWAHVGRRGSKVLRHLLDGTTVAPKYVGGVEMQSRPGAIH